MIFKHYKGGLYKLDKHLAHMDVNEEIVEMIVYTSLETGITWVRPKDEFFGLVEVKGEKRRRFKPVNAEQPAQELLDLTDAECYALIHTPLNELSLTVLRSIAEGNTIISYKDMHPTVQLLFTATIHKLLIAQHLGVDDEHLKQYLRDMQVKSDELNLDSEEAVLSFIVKSLRESGFICAAKKVEQK